MINLLDASTRTTVLQFGCGEKHQRPEFYSIQPSEEFTFHRQFEQQVQRAADRIAVRAEDCDSAGDAIAWTYQRLNQEANAIATRLMNLGVGVEDTVGIVMDRRCCLLAAMIGIMKAGARYVGLEPNLPLDRLAFIVQDANIVAMVTDNVHVGRAAEIVDSAGGNSAIEIVNWDSETFCEFKRALGDAINQNPQTGVHSRNGAYLIYTSGSTGKPKGVDVWHHSFVNFCSSFAAMLELSQSDTCLAITTISFDVSIAELFPLLRIGGTVALGSKQVGANGQHLSALIEKVSATYLCATPTSLRILVASGWKESQQLTVVAGGEPVSALVCNEVGPKVRRIINGYGPTEATVYATVGNLSADQTEPVPIGPPIVNSRLYVLDDDGNLVPPMVTGKLFIGGQSPARGYWNRPELTAEKFVDDPFVDPNEFPNAKMYDSGDNVYWREDGILQYLGRSDQQVKLRGYRIELGEIEAQLNRHAAVKDSVVIVREDVPGQQRLVAYVIYDFGVRDQELQDHVASALPDYMVPSWFVALDSFPTNANFKLDRKRLPDPDSIESDNSDSNSQESDSTAASDANDLISAQNVAVEIAKIWSEILHRKIRLDDRVFRMGADSLTAVKFQIRLENDLGRKISIGEVFQYPTPLALATQLRRHLRTSHKSSDRPTDRTAIRDIAIVGMAGRFPGAANVDQFWENLINGVESIQDFSEEQLIAEGVSASEYLQENYIRRGTVIDDAYDFEPEFFGITRNDAEIVSPQIRLFMKTVWEALEHAGYPAEPADHRIGVFAGGGLPNYLAPWRHVPEAERLQRLIGNGADFMATRTSYALGLTGPAVGIQTACSSSLVAVAYAVDAIRAGKCDMAIAGGSSFSWPHRQGYRHGEGLIYSADGHCRAFDHRATGTLFSQAAGAILIRPLEDAIADGDTIHAVIKGIAVNNDGHRKGGYASPSIEGQAEVIRMALDDAAISAEQISLMEAHGTGTKIGDPIEVAGLSRAWLQDTDKRGYCALGSVKANVGHADAAAGIVGLLKLVMSLKHRQIVPLINFEEPNPEIDFDSTPFFISDQATDWDTGGDVRFAAVSSFGMGGTNAHAVLCEGQAFDKSKPNVSVDDRKRTAAKSLQLIPFSARTPESLSMLVQQFAESDVALKFDLQDIGHTLRYGRKHFKRRGFAVVDSGQQLQASLSEVVLPTKPALRRKVVFMFTGQGAQYAAMAKELYEREPVFRSAIKRCDEVLRANGASLVDWLFDDQSTIDINQTQYAQIALFSVSYAQARLWQSWGVEPAALVGHSIGEYAAAAISGVMALDDAVKIVTQRGLLMQKQPAGSMLAVMHGETPIATLLNFEAASEIDLAVVNSPSVAVVAGTDAAIDRFAAELDARDIKSKKLHTSHAFHSRMMDSMLDPFLSAFENVRLNNPAIAYLSNVSGTWITNEQATDANYYASQIRSTVRFSDNLQTLFDDDEDLLLIEMGPGSTLTQLAKSQFSGKSHAAVATLPTAKEASVDSQRFTWQALGHAWAAGLEIDWARLHQIDPNLRPRRVPLPTYRFHEQTYRASSERTERIGASTDFGKDDHWFNVPSWRQSFPVDRIVEPAFDRQCDRWLLLVNDASEAEIIQRQLGDCTAISVTPSDRFSQVSENWFTVQPGNEADYTSLIEAIDATDRLAGVVHAWSLTEKSSSLVNDFWHRHEMSALSVAWLSKAIGECVVDRMIPLNVITTGVSSVDPGVVAIPENHCLIGGASVIQKEYRCIATKVIDVGSDLGIAVGIEGFDAMLKSNHHERLLAVDRQQWWTADFEQVTLPETDTSQIENGSVIVFTGGLGGLARNMAIQLADQYSQLSVALLVRTPLPEESNWDSVMAQCDDVGSEIRQRIVDVRRLRENCQVEMLTCDVSRAEEVTRALKLIKRSFGKIDAVFHTAGILNDGVVATRTDELIRPVLESKSLAAKNISEAILKDHADVKCVAFFSSISADLGMFGQFAYSAANNYLDGLCQQLTTASKTTTQFFTLNWPAFRAVGMAVRTQANVSSDAALLKELADNSFSISEGTAALLRVINNRHHRVAISKKPFSDRLAIAIEDSNSVGVFDSDSDDTASVTQSGSADEKMLAIWRQQFGNNDLDLDVDYFELGGDSLMAVGMIAQIERVFGKMMPISHLINSPTPRKLIGKLDLEPTPAKSDFDHTRGAADGTALVSERKIPDYVICLKEGSSSESPLFLIHGADGSVLFYRDFANRLDTDRTIYAVQSPSLSDDSWQIPESVEQLAAHYAAAIKSIQQTGPYWIAGYSFGGVAAFEIARQIESSGEAVETLVLFDIPNPSTVEQNGALDRLKIFWNRQNDTAASRKVMRLTKRTFQAVLDRATVEIENRIARSKSEETDSAFWRHRKARERHMQIEESYIPRKLEGPLRIVSATDNSSKFRVDDQMGWGIVSDDLKVREVSGSHLELFNKEYVGGMLKSTEFFLKEFKR